MEETDMIMRELAKEDISAGKPFSHFGWEGSGAFSFLTISDGYWESAKILLEKMTNESNDFAIVDTLIYPLFFNYRHSIETYLKLLFFNYGEHTHDARCGFLMLGHDLQKLWASLRPYLNKGRKHVGSSVNLNAVEYYIKSINAFDPDSMVMRYPVEKNLTANKSLEYHFDFINFGERMNELCHSLRQLDYDLTSQMSEAATPEELDDYLGIIDKYRSQIDDFISILKEEAANEHKRTFKFEGLYSIIGKEPSKTISFLKKCKPDLLILLDNLFYGGRSVNEHVVRLSCSPVERQKEFVRFCNELLEKDGLCFEVVPEDGQINIWGKTSSALLDGISKALSIIDLEP